jgi:transcriptional antiterminator RfaH
MQTNPDNSPMLWHALVVKSRMERATGQVLAENGFETIVPVQRQLRQWSDRKKWVDVVLFNSYVFVGTTQERRFEALNAPYAFKWVQFGNRIATLTETEVGILRGLDGFNSPVHIQQSILPHIGEEVEIIRGSLAGYRGFVVAVQGKTKVRLALSTLGCFAEVEVMMKDVRTLAVAS